MRRYRCLKSLEPAAKAAPARYRVKPNRISKHWNDDWNRIGRFFYGDGLNTCRGDDEIGIELDQFLRRLGKPLHLKIGRSVYHLEIPAFDEPEFSHPLQEQSEISGGNVRFHRKTTIQQAAAFWSSAPAPRTPISQSRRAGQ